MAKTSRLLVTYDHATMRFTLKHVLPLTARVKTPALLCMPGMYFPGIRMVDNATIRCAELGINTYNDAALQI